MQVDVMLANNHYRDINPLVCGWEDCSPGYVYGPASRDYLLLHFVRSGRGRFGTPRGEYAVGPGQIFVIHPLELTRYQADERAPWVYAWIGFESSISLPGALRGDVIDAPQSRYLFDALSAAGSITQGREMYLCGKIYELLSLLSALDDPPAPGARARDYVRKAKNYMESNYPRPIGVAQIARELGLERSYFCHLFKSQVGRPPQRYLTDLRLQKAAELIAVHGYAPGEAARSAGYQDPVNFSRMFKKRYGVPPSAYGRRGT